MLMWMDSGASHSSRRCGRFFLRSQVSTFWITEHPDDRRIMFQLLKDFRLGSQGLKGVQSTRNLFVVTKSLLSTASNSDGPLVQTPLWVLYPFAVCSARVFSARVRSGFPRKEHLVSPLTCRLVCLPLNVPDVEHLVNIFQPQFEVGGASRVHVLLAEKGPHCLRRAQHLHALPSFSSKMKMSTASHRSSHKKEASRSVRDEDARRTARRRPGARGPASTSHIPMSARRSIGEQPEQWESQDRSG